MAQHGKLYHLLNMKEELEKLEDERQEILLKIRALEEQKNQLMTRYVELQGVIKYLQEKVKKEDKSNQEEENNGKKPI